MENFIDLRSPAYPKDPFGKCRGYVIGFHTQPLESWANNKHAILRVVSTTFTKAKLREIYLDAVLIVFFTLPHFR